MATIKVKYMVVTSKAAAWSHEAPYFSFSATRTKEELKTELLAKAKCMGHGTLLLRDEDDDFAEWDEPVPLPTSGTICVKVAVDSTGKVLLDSDIMRRVEEAEARQNEAEARIAELCIQQNKDSQTTETAQKLGSVWMKRAHKVMQLSCLPPLAEGANIVRTACTAVLSRIQTTADPTGRVSAKKQKHEEPAEPDVHAPSHMGGVTLADLIPESTEAEFKEEVHMQPVLIDLIQAVMDAVQCDCCLFDTHSASNQLQDPNSRPDCTLVAAGDMAMWTQVVSVWEFKIGSSQPDRERMYGQQVERCRYVLSACDQRQYAVAVSFTMNSLEVMTVERQAHQDIKLSTTGPQPFSISDDSPGFQLLVKLLSTAKSDLGFVTSSLPQISQLEDHKFTVRLLVRKGTAQLGSGSWVFLVRLESGSDAILKLNSSSNESNVLSRLKGCAHLVQMLGRGTRSYAGTTWMAILLVPMAHKLKCTDSLTLFCQVLFDAGGIANAAKRDIAHRDITPNNFGQLDGRGYLYDFSAAKDMAGRWDSPRSQCSSLTGITGTVLWAALSVLEGEQHSLSSMLEGLFISALSISCNGKLHFRHAMKPDQLAFCAKLRRGHLTSPKLAELPHVVTHLQPLIIGLHDLFYPLARSSDKYRAYSTKVTLESVQGVCRRVCSNLTE